MQFQHNSLRNWATHRESVHEKARAAILGINVPEFRAESWQNGFWTDVSRIFIVEPLDFFADFVAGFFSSFLWEQVPRKILQENPQKNPPKCIQQNLWHTFLQRGRPNRVRSSVSRGFRQLSQQCEQGFSSAYKVLLSKNCQSRPGSRQKSLPKEVKSDRPPHSLLSRVKQRGLRILPQNPSPELREKLKGNN